MLIPKHCSNPKCHKPYISKDGTDWYREVLVKLNTEMQIRVLSVCKECRKDYNLEMAESILKEVLPIEINQIMENALMTNSAKMEKIKQLTNYKIVAIGRDIDEINKKL